MDVMWVLLSILASVLWGLLYVLSEDLYTHISVVSKIGILCFFISITMLVVSWMRGDLVPDLKVITGSKDLLLLFLCIILISIAAELCIGYSIALRNATLAALIEISYPLFTVFFSILLYRVNHLSVSVIIGGLMIMGGVTVISLSHK